MASDWQVGDLAVCVDDRPRPQEPNAMPLQVVKKGQTHRVSSVGIDPKYGDTVLTLDGVNGFRDTLTGTYGAYRFRKIRPDKREACEPEFVALLKRNLVPA